jgi:IclR family mhp operon transcriptional activator
MTDKEPGAYRLCQSLSRGLDILAALNRSASAAATITELAKSTGLHRTTVKRLLETLREAGYVQSEPSHNQYRLTFRVQALSSGFRDNIWITETAWPHLHALSKKLVWPCTLLTLEGDELTVRASTRSSSPLSFHPGMPGRRLPLLSTAAGRAYLAFCPDDERQALLDLLRTRDDEQGLLAGNAAQVRAMLEETRRRGWSINHGDWSLERKFGGIAVPLRYGGRVMACLNVVYLLRAMKEGEAIERFAGDLLAAAGEIEAGFRSVRHRPAPG